MTVVVSFRALACHRTLATHILVGMGAASFWRGTWYVLDDHLFPDNAVSSAVASWTMGVVGLASCQGLMGTLEAAATATSRYGGQQQQRRLLLPARWGAVYCVATSCVLVWRGTWVGWDCLYEYLCASTRTAATTTTTTAAAGDNNSSSSSRTVAATDPGHATRSGLLSHTVAVGCLVAAGLLTSILAPPAAISILRDATVRGGKTTNTIAALTNRMVASSSPPPVVLAARAATAERRMTQAGTASFVRSCSGWPTLTTTDRFRCPTTSNNSSSIRRTSFATATTTAYRSTF